ncbi:MAG: 2-polyprenyl-3-methyl-5-hydroxy-6-metoxy-1,4-benzoquinol methylase [Parasphingorhabdus sp.]|jgi:2-polyprenyl-3-methyl-5-hydroxy-6-metoxy-1,4-benzoquinol methylase
MKHSDEDIVDSWLENAQPWVTAVRQTEIESRVLVTNKAITEVILKKSPKTVLDIGCGEGWLARELNKTGINVLGIDVISELVTAATEKGGGIFKVISYEDLAEGAINEKFDLIVSNFSMLGKESVNVVFKCISRMLNNGGYFIVQTIHPITACGDLKYADGWREGSWAGFNSSFSNPSPWYFRTLATWKNLFLHNGFALNEVLEPINVTTNKAASVIFIGEL